MTWWHAVERIRAAAPLLGRAVMGWAILVCRS
jgi:hypothetical protein